MMKILFTHIPKTAGTSFIQQLVVPNLGNEALCFYMGRKTYLQMNMPRKRFVSGHFHYGIHKYLLEGGHQYITFFRDPVERAVSHYYFIRSGKVKGYEHPLYQLCMKNSLREVYEKNILIPNLSTRYISGINGDRRATEADLERAMYNLEHKYAVFGLQERYEDSLDLFNRSFGWDKSLAKEVQRFKETPKKPLIEEDTIEILRKAHQLDVNLYAFAKERFEKLFIKNISVV